MISANQWGIRIDGTTATGNLIEGNYVGTDSTGRLPLGNEINGIILSNERLEQHDRRHRRRTGELDRLQRAGGGARPVRNGRLDPLE